MILNRRFKITFCLTLLFLCNFQRTIMKDKSCDFGLSKLNRIRGFSSSKSISSSVPQYVKDILKHRLHRKEVIQPQVLLRLPCYDFTPITSFTFGGVLLAVRLPTSGPPGSHGVTGGVYKARERIHRGMLIHDY